MERASASVTDASHSNVDDRSRYRSRANAAMPLLHRSESEALFVAALISRFSDEMFGIVYAKANSAASNDI